VKGRTVIVVDDGLATGLTDLAAVRALRKLGARRIVVAVPVGAAPAVSMLEQEADRVICLTSPEPLLGVGAWYRDFAPTSDEEVVALLSQAAERADAQTPSIAAGSEAVPLRTEDEARNETLTFDLGGVRLTGNLTLPPTAFGLVLFAHGSGSSRMSPRNRAVAQALNDAGLATLLFELLARRLQEVTRWAASEAAVSALPIGYFGASTGAAAALIAAAATPDAVAAVVCRGGRPDLAGHRLADVRAPTLLIVGGNDPEVLDLNRQAAARLLCPHEVVVVDAAGHLFEERGALERVAELAIDWFKRQLAQPVQALSRAGEQ